MTAEYSINFTKANAVDGSGKSWEFVGKGSTGMASSLDLHDSLAITLKTDPSLGGLTIKDAKSSVESYPKTYLNPANPNI